MTRCGVVGNRRYYTGITQPLQQTMPHSPEWVVDLIPEVPEGYFVAYVSDPNNPHLYAKNEVRNYADLFVNRSANASGGSIVLKVARNGGYAYAVEYAGGVVRVAGNTFVNNCGVVGSKIKAMIALQETDFRSEEEVMQRHYCAYTNRLISEMENGLGLSLVDRIWLRRGQGYGQCILT